MPEFRPGKPRVKVGLTAPLVIGNGLVPMPWDTLVFEEGWPTAVPTTQLVVPRDGLYLVRCQWGRASSTANAVTDARVLRNGVVIARGNSTTGSAGGSYFSLSALEELLEGDSLEVHAQGAVGAGQTASIALSSSFGAARVGPVRWT